MKRRVIFGLLASVSTAAHASDKPIYAPAPDWIAPAPPIDTAKQDPNAPQILLYDSQARLKDGVAWTYINSAARVASEQMLGAMGTITLPWMPDRGDLIVHQAEIVRGTEHVDLLKTGDKFTVLRREEMMEQRLLTGILTATMSVEGLRVGDVLHLSYSVSQSDPTLKGRGQLIALTPATPFRASFGRVRLLWPAGDKVKWKTYADGANPVEKTVAGFHELTVPLPLAKQPEMPGDLPARFNRLPIIEATTFADWTDVSRTLAPLYDTKELIAPGSPLATEMAAIATAEKDPLHRAERALELVQDKVRYLAVAMNGGGLVPQAPAQTWTLRYGDCKAKTLLLLALLHGLGIEAEAVAASAQTTGLVSERLAAPEAFDHVLVRATIGGETLWLDGTRSGSRLADIHDSPPFQFVLPLRAAGAALMPVPIHADARPDRIVDIALDQSAGVDFPTVFNVKFTVRGGFAQAIEANSAQTTEDQRREFVRGMVQQEVGDAQLSRYAIDYDASTATATISGSGVITTPWSREDGRYREAIDKLSESIEFDPDRGRAAWQKLPVATPGPDSAVYHMVVTLPFGVKGFALEGAQTLPTTVAARTVARHVALADGKVIVDDRIDSTGTEISPENLAAERSRYNQIKARPLTIDAPSGMPERWQAVQASTKDGRFKAIECAFDAAIANDPKEVSGYQSRASFRAGIYDRKGAINDLTAAITLQPDAPSLLRRGQLYALVGDDAKAVTDFEAARALDSSDDGALISLVDAKADGGDVKAALTLLDDRIAQGDKARYVAIDKKAELLATSGKAAEGVTLMDEAVADRPTDGVQYNGRCWVKAIGNVALDTALKDCTKAIELLGGTSAPLDSRALVYYRLNRLDDALADLNAALEINPRETHSRYMRGVIRKKMGDNAADNDLIAARMDLPTIDKEYARYGIKG